MIANRGEIALRVINACRELGMRTVAVYSEADRNSLHVRFADEAICIGPPRAADSYLNVPAVISAAEIADVDAIHPGYGLLSENANFAEVCRASNIKFIGPPPEVTRLMGEKEKARQAMKEAKVPILPGSDGVLGRRRAKHSRLPKRSAIPSSSKPRPAAAAAACASCAAQKNCPTSSMPHPLKPPTPSATASSTWRSSSSSRATSSSRFWPTSTATSPRSSSASAPSSAAIRSSSKKRRRFRSRRRCARRSASTLVRCLTDIGYQNAGTVEFLMDEDGKLYFIEMNTRIQVEHPVTEAITGVDLVKAQLRIASGEKLSDILPPKLEIRGHAIECRINAEHPRKFTPSAGKITAFNVPGGNGVRVDTAQYAEGVVPPYYDSLIAKLICYGVDREEAMARMERALSQFVVQGIDTSIPLHQAIFRDEDFRAGKFDTKFMERFLAKQTE